MKYIKLFENYLNDNFWNWFKGSKVIDSEGNPLVVYHGSSEYFTEFAGYSFFTEDYFNAEGYSGEDGYVYEVYLSIKNPLIIDAKGRMYNNIDSPYGNTTIDIINNVDDNKYDGIIFNNIKDSWIDDEDYQEPITIYVTFNSNQIKSTDNNGDFSNSSNINEKYRFKKYSIKDIKDYILIKKDNLLLLLSPTEEPIGYINYTYSDDNVYSIMGAYAKKGYGTILYEIVMNLVYPKGITLSDESGTSSDAMNVYKRFFERDDIKKEKIKRTKKSEKEIELLAGADENDPWIQEILYLHNHKYIFEFNNLSKNILNHILQRGEEYMKNHPDLFIDEILWELEEL